MTHPLSETPVHLAAADFNGDGKSDLIIGTDPPGGINTVDNLHFLAGRGDGTFQASAKIEFASTDILVGDLTGDGRPDAVIPDGDWLSILSISNSGEFVFEWDLRSSGVSALADLNGDGRLDIVESSGLILFNNSSAPSHRVELGPAGIAEDLNFGTQVSGPPWRNPRNNLDVDDSGIVVPLDALRIINELNDRRLSDALGRLPTPLAPVPLPPPFLDPNGDDFVTPLDVLLIINHLNNRSSQGSEGEQETQPTDLTAGSPPDASWGAILYLLAEDQLLMRRRRPQRMN